MCFISSIRQWKKMHLQTHFNFIRLDDVGSITVSLVHVFCVLPHKYDFPFVADASSCCLTQVMVCTISLLSENHQKWHLWTPWCRTWCLCSLAQEMPLTQGPKAPLWGLGVPAFLCQPSSSILSNEPIMSWPFFLSCEQSDFCVLLPVVVFSSHIENFACIPVL